jgi:peptidoglycan hydrolase-like protein with peptidoglycan-binding domain
MRPIERNQAPAPSVPSCDVSPAEISDAQEALNYIAGDERLPVSGRLDQATRAAITAFQRSERLPETGCLDAATQTALLEATVERNAGTQPASGGAPVGRSQNEIRPNTRVNIQFRSFAPFRDFGGGFGGDNRSFSADPSASSRLRTRVEVDTRENTSRIHHSTSGTHHPWLGSDNAAGHGSAEIHPIGHGVSMMTFSQSGANPLIPGSPDIDRRATVILDESTPGHLKLQVRAEGNSFPNCEMSISDISGQSIFLDGYATPYGEHAPLNHLFGEGDTPLLQRHVDVLVDGRGRFMGVVLPDGQPITVEEWNRRVITAERNYAHATDAGRQWF